jgi:hypothetical protein
LSQGEIIHLHDLRKKLTTVSSILFNTPSLSTFVKLVISFNAPAINALNNPHNLLAKFRQLKLSLKSFLTSLSLAEPSFCCLANNSKQNLRPVHQLDIKR